MLSARRPRTGLVTQRDSAIPGRRRGARGAGRADAQPRARSGAAAFRPQQVGPAGGAGIGGFSETAAARRSWGFCGLCAITFRGDNPGPRAFASHTLRSAESPASPGLRSPWSELAAAAGGLAQTKGAKAAERSAAWPARGRCPHPRLPLRTAQSCSRAMFLSVGAPRAPEAAAARRSRPGAVASLGPHRRPPPLPLQRAQRLGPPCRVPDGRRLPAR